MPAIGFGVAWAGYTLMLWGYLLLHGDDVTLGQLVNPVHRLDWKTATAAKIPAGQILPGGATAASASGSGPGGSTPIPGSAAVKPKTPGKCPPGYLWDGSKCLQELG